MRNLRISIGNASCAGRNGLPPLDKGVCEYILNKIAELRKLSISSANLLSAEKSEEIKIDNHRILVTTYRSKLENGDVLVVIQAFLRTLRFPRYFSCKGIGKIFAEGILFDSEGNIRPASDEILHSYR